MRYDSMPKNPMSAMKEKKKQLSKLAGYKIGMKRNDFYI